MAEMKKLDTKQLQRSMIFYIASSMLVLVLVTAVVSALIQNYRQDQREAEYAQQVNFSIKHEISKGDAYSFSRWNFSA